ncbi:MAG: phage terminase small subunit P27 family [Chloroflexi bacterium]|nr:MAG: phage terminase small subunit P27 family [Chloroflexota bacterium]
MSTRGRKPKPSQLKRVQGNPGKRPLNRREPKPQSAVKRPRGMRGLPRKFWDEYADELERIGVLTGVDTAVFRLAAEAFGFAIEAAEQLKQTGFTVDGRDGPKKHPLAQVWRDNAQLFRQFATEFGMTPSSRARLQLPAEAEQLSIADELMRAAAAMIDIDDGTER